MAKLPNGERARIPMEKLTDYCLNPDHPRGKDKARVFASLLGITRDGASELAALVQQAATDGDITKEEVTMGATTGWIGLSQHGETSYYGLFGKLHQEKRFHA
jgi:hypothetical protein